MPVLSTGLKNPASGSVIGVGGINWSSAGNILSSDDAWASCSLAIGQASDYLWANSFSFGIPSTAYVIGVNWDIERHENYVTNYISDNIVKISKSSSDLSPTNKAAAGFWPNSDATASYGSALDISGYTRITANEANSALFGVVIRVVNSNSLGTTDALVDNVKVNVTYITQNPSRMMI